MKTGSVVIVFNDGSHQKFVTEEGWGDWRCKLMDRVVLIYRSKELGDKKTQVDTRVFTLHSLMSIVIDDITDESSFKVPTLDELMKVIEPDQPAPKGEKPN